MNYGTIYIELENPRDLHIAVRVKEPGRYQAYIMDEVKYGRDFIDDIEESDQFTQLAYSELEASVGDIYEWRTRYKERFVQAYVHKTITP